MTYTREQYRTVLAILGLDPATTGALRLTAHGLDVESLITDSEGRIVADLGIVDSRVDSYPAEVTG